MVYQQQGDDDENGSISPTRRRAEAIELTDRRNVADMSTTVDKDDVLAAMTSSLSGEDLRLEVTCGQNQAVLYTSRLQLGTLASTPISLYGIVSKGAGTVGSGGSNDPQKFTWGSTWNFDPPDFF